MVVRESQQGILQNQSSNVDTFHRTFQRRIRHVRKGDEDVSECVPEDRMCLHRVMPGRLYELPRPAPDMSKHAEEAFERRYRQPARSVVGFGACESF